MQHRMKTHGLTQEEIRVFLEKSLVGRIVTQNHDGYPYAVPIHFIYHNDKIYTHGLPKGQKLDNIKTNSKVCFEVDEMRGLIFDNVKIPCDTNTEFKSVIALGNANILEDVNYKKEIFNKIIEKYTPQFIGQDIPDNMVRGTAVIEIEISECTGKYYN